MSSNGRHIFDVFKVSYSLHNSCSLRLTDDLTRQTAEFITVLLSGKRVLRRSPR